MQITRLAYAILISLAMWAILIAVVHDVAFASPTEAEAIAIADRWAAKDAPGHVNHCADGKLFVQYKPDLGKTDEGHTILGLAYGWASDGVGGWWWNPAACHAALRYDLEPALRCWVRAHELMHFVIGPQHVGPLDPRHPGAVECYAVKPKQAPKRQTARSKRYHRMRAKIKARAAMRRMHR